MIDPFNITDYQRSEAELQELLIFAVSVAGKKAVMIRRKVHEFLKHAKEVFGSAAKQHYRSVAPFDLLRVMRSRNMLTYMIERHKLGKTRVLTEAFTQFAGLADQKVSLKRISLDQLEGICGIGFKTSRFFLLHSRPNQNVSALDVHMLANLRSLGYDAPSVTPSSKSTYNRLEKIVVDLAAKKKMSAADYDLMVWRQRTKTKPEEWMANAPQRRTRKSGRSLQRQSMGSGRSRIG